MWLGGTNKQNDFGWLPAENLGSEVNTSANDGGAVYFEDDQTGAATLYFFSTRAGVAGGVNIFASMLQADETWGTPQLVPELSSPSADSQPGISRNGLEFFVSSNRPGSGSLNFDIWVSTRQNTAAPWSVPVNAGPIINLASPYYQGRPSLSFDGTKLYFYAYRPDSYGAQDIYVSTRVKVRDRDQSSRLPVDHGGVRAHGVRDLLTRRGPALSRTLDATADTVLTTFDRWKAAMQEKGWR